MKISTSLDHAIKIDKVSSRESARIMKKVGFEGIDLALCHDMDAPEKVLAPHWADRVYEDADAACQDVHRVAWPQDLSAPQGGEA